MRLINVDTFEIEDFNQPDNVPEYAILSHRWTNKEVEFKQFQKLNKTCLKNPENTDYGAETSVAKAAWACLKARQQNIKYVWMDTCCIDRRSNVELGQAINSMFRWYRNAKVCYAFLFDVTIDPSEFMETDGKVLGPFESSQWFKRGWTLQELLAPRNLRFFDHRWRFMGSVTEQTQHRM